jgi:hypothetical protein
MTRVAVGVEAYVEIDRVDQPVGRAIIGEADGLGLGIAQHHITPAYLAYHL